jgi:hypothetical protein
MSSSFEVVGPPTPENLIEGILANAQPHIADKGYGQAIEHKWEERVLLDGTVVQVSSQQPANLPVEYAVTRSTLDGTTHTTEQYSLTPGTYLYVKGPRSEAFSSYEGLHTERITRPMTKLDRDDAVTLIKGFLDADS